MGSPAALLILYLDLVSLFQMMNVPSLPTVQKVLNFLLKEMLFTV